jgi:dolichol-phosphate mannosyltransferase
MDVRAGIVGITGTAMKVAIVVPAHNEERRIGRMLDTYLTFFSEKEEITVTFIIVLNGCTDNTLSVVKEREHKGSIFIIDLKKAGKGLAIKKGFEESLKTKAELIGFVDADMATRPEYFYELIQHLDGYDGIIASRYMKESKVYPPRPVIKAWGRRFIYQPLIWLLFGLRFKDYQCGAKLFKRNVIEKITPYLSVKQWAFDTELLYLCKLFGFSIREWSTVWHDQTDSKLKLRSGFRMLGSLFAIRWKHSFLGKKPSISPKE